MTICHLLWARLKPAWDSTVWHRGIGSLSEGPFSTPSKEGVSSITQRSGNMGEQAVEVSLYRPEQSVEDDEDEVCCWMVYVSWGFSHGWQSLICQETHFTDRCMSKTGYSARIYIEDESWFYPSGINWIMKTGWLFGGEGKMNEM